MSPTHERWTPRFHLAPRQGWLNDPNGLCQFHGTYHVFYQAAPAWPASGKKGWGHFASRDLVRWEDLGEPLVPSIPEDADGVYSGSALVVAGGAPDGGDLLRLYYTGNVKYEAITSTMDATPTRLWSQARMESPSLRRRSCSAPRTTPPTSRATCATPRSGSRADATTWCWVPAALTTWATSFSTSPLMPWSGRIADASSPGIPLATCGSAPTSSRWTAMTTS